VILGLYEHPEKYLVFTQDITEQKELEIRTQRQSKELLEQQTQLEAYTKELEGFQQVLEQKLEEARSEMREQIREIEAGKARHAAILEGCVDGVISFNHRGMLEFINQAAEELWGCPREQVLGRSVTLMLPIFFEKDEDDLNVWLKIGDDQRKPIGIRTEATFTSTWKHDELDVLLTLTRVRIDHEYTFTLFVQNISVELF
jgi:PAS domain S-box-containing protein